MKFRLIYDPQMGTINDTTQKPHIMRLAMIPGPHKAHIDSDRDELGHLLAAAPDMLAALRRAEYQLAEEVERRGDEDDEYESPMAPVLADVRAVIAKAEGRTNG